MFVSNLRPAQQIRLSDGVAIKNLGTNNAKLGLELPPDVKVVRNHRKNNHRKGDPKS